MDNLYSVTAILVLAVAVIWAYAWLVRTVRRERDAILLALMERPLTLADLLQRLGPKTHVNNVTVRLEVMEQEGLIVRVHTAERGTLYLLDDMGEVAAWRARGPSLRNRKPNQS